MLQLLTKIHVDNFFLESSNLWMIPIIFYQSIEILADKVMILVLGFISYKVIMEI